MTIQDQPLTISSAGRASQEEQPAEGKAVAGLYAASSRCVGSPLYRRAMRSARRPVTAAFTRPAGTTAGMTMSADFSIIPEVQRQEKIEQLCATMDATAEAGYYPRLTVVRPWSEHNPVLQGEFTSPWVIRWYLKRELGQMAAAGACISVAPGGRAVDLRDPDLISAVDETQLDLRRKKLFLFGPERMALSMDRLQHYTGTAADKFQRYVLLTNYARDTEEFRATLPISTGPDSSNRQMPAWHYERPDRSGLTMINIGIGPSNAKTITDHLAVLRPDMVLMIGHCAGLRNSQEIGDLVLATGYMRDDRVLDDILPLSVPVVSNYTLNTLLLDELTSRGLRSRMGTVFTTVNRNWELQFSSVASLLQQSRALAVDMESATVAANGFRYRMPTATLLAVSDKPLHGRPKLSADAQRFYEATRQQHVETAIAVARKVRRLYPGGLPTADIRFRRRATVRPDPFAGPRRVPDIEQVTDLMISTTESCRPTFGGQSRLRSNHGR